MRNVREYPEAMARLQMDNENQRAFQPPAPPMDPSNMVPQLRQEMKSEYDRAEEERRRRFLAAKNDATQAAGYTPGMFQDDEEGGPLEAHVSRSQ